MSGWPVSIADVHFGYEARGGAGVAEGAPVLQGVSLDVPAGQVVALLGPNGAGKTTLTRMLVGLLRPGKGRVTVGNWDVAARRPDEMARRVGYAFQHADQQLFARTVYDDVAFGPRQLGLGSRDVSAVLEELGIVALAGRHPYDLPAPLRKLVALAGVFAMRPGVLVLDEPTAGMDLALRAVVVEAVRRRAAQAVTVIAVSHDLTFVAEIADRVVTLRDGAVASDRAAPELLYDRVALAALGLAPPAGAAIGAALNLAGSPVREDDVAHALAGARWRMPG